MEVHGIERGLAFQDGSSAPISFHFGGVLRFTKVFDVSMVLVNVERVVIKCISVRDKGFIVAIRG